MIQDNIDSFEGLTIQYENIDLDDLNVEHISVTDRDMDSRQACIGSDSRMVNALLVIEIYTKQGTGTEKARKVTNELCSMFSNSNTDIVFTGGPEFMPIGPKEGTTLYQHNLTVPYMYEYGNN